MIEVPSPQNMSINVILRFSFSEQYSDTDPERKKPALCIMKCVTSFLWLSFVLFFRSRARRTVGRICPQGTHAAIGGRHRRNLNTLGQGRAVTTFEQLNQLICWIHAK